MNYLDIIIAVPLLWFAYKGFSKGLVIELASLLALILGIYLAFNFSDITEDFLKNTFNLETDYIHIIAFAITFIGVVIVTRLVGRLVESVVKMVMMGFLNNLAGAIFGLLKVALIISALFYMVQMVSPGGSVFSEETRKKSLLYKPVSSLAYIILPKIEEIDWEKHKPVYPEEEAERDSLRLRDI